MSTSVNFDVVWGGYYAKQSTQTRDFSVFRLLDFNEHAYHAALYSQRVPSFPSADLVRGLTPFIGHAPIDPRVLVREGPAILVTRAPLSRTDLEGYLYFLEAHDVPEPDREHLVESLIRFSHEPPLPLRLELSGDALSVIDR